MTRANPRTSSVWRATRARAADADGVVDRDGVRIFWESFGTGEPTVLILPTWSVLHAAHGQFQIADLARHYRVVTFDPRGNGRSDRPIGAAAYDDREFVGDALAVLDATSTERAVVIGCSSATYWLLGLAGDHPDRVLAAVSSGTNLPLAPGHRRPENSTPFGEPYRSSDGWAKWNAAYWRDHYEEFLRFFFSQVWTEPHSTSVIEDCVTWGLETTPETLIDTAEAPGYSTTEVVELTRRVRCPVLVLHGSDDVVTPPERSARLAEATNGSLVIIEGAGHCSGNRDPVVFDRLIREFIESVAGPSPAETRWARAAGRERRALLVPADGDGAVRRDIAIAAALNAIRPDVRVEWLAPPSTHAELMAHGATLHPASHSLLGGPTGPNAASLSYDEWRRHDEARFVDFMIFADVVDREAVDLVIADGAWQVDNYLHENPELKRFAYVWLTDTVGWPPTPDADELEAQLRTDANAAMVDLVGRYPRLRDLAFFLGGPDDLSMDPLGPGLPGIRAWAVDHLSIQGSWEGEQMTLQATSIAESIARLV